MTTPRRPDVISHRGLCRAEWTADRFGENTIEAMVEGVEALRRLGQSPAVEFDVRATSDRKLVVMHDDTLDRTTNGSGRVVEHTLAAITKCDAGDGRRVPQLSDVLARFKGQKDVTFHVEIKQRGIADLVADAIKTAGVADRCVVSAFTSEDDWDEGHGRATQGWDELAAFQPSVRIALLCTKERLEAQGTDWLLEEATLRKAWAIHIESTATTDKLVKAAHARGLLVNVFTVNDPDEYLRLAGLGVDGVFCDNPAFVLNFQTSVLPDELAFIQRSRELRKTEDRLDPATAASRPTVGMAFSGGGIRSATFNLGVLQGMAQLGLLSKVDYLSTVSGGGYIGTWLTAWIRRKGVEAVEAGLRNDQFAQNGGAEVQEIRALREFSNYLTPRVGFTSGDTWAFAGAYVRNLLLNQIIIALALSALLLLPRLLTYYSAQMARATPAHGTPSWWALGVGIVLALLALTVTLLNLSSQGRPTGSKRGRVRLATPMLVDLLVVIPILASVWLLWSWWWAIETRGIGWRWELLIGGAGFGVVWAVSWFVSEVIRAWDNDAEGQSQLAQAAKDYSVPFLSLAGWAVVAGVIGAVLADGAWRVLQDPWLQQRVPEGRLVCWGMPLAMGVLLVVETLHVGLVGRGFTEDAREWWGRLGGQLAFATIGLTAVSAIAIEGPWVIEHFSRFRIGSVLGAGWAGITSAALVLSRRPPAKPDETPGRISRLVFSVAPPIFVGGLLLAASVGIDLGLPALMERLERSGHVHAIAASFLESTRWSTHPHWSDFAETLDWTLWLLVIAGFAAAFVLSWRSGINRFSTNALYRNRLVRCYLGASNRRRPQPFTGMDPTDDSIAFDDLAAPAAPGGQPAYDGPYPIINTTLNLVDTQNLAWQQRKGASFTFTPLHTGYEVQTKDRGPLFAFRRSDLFRRRLKLGLAMAISGAAASPNMGEQSSGALSALLTVFNVRLGWWLANPRFDPGDPWGLGPKVGLFYLFFELMGRTNQDNDYVYLSDGGHFENLGVYELVRRRCRYIVISDAGEDHAIAFADLGNAIEKCRTDFGVDIEIDIEPLRPKGDPKLSQWHCAVGVIHYELVNPAWPPGIVAYIKATMTGDEPTDVQRYAAQETAFPHQSTANQWFTESQFESYRALGRHIVLESAGVLGDRDSLSQLRAEEFFVKLKEHWYPPSRFVQAAFTKHTATYTALLEKLRAQPDLLGFLDPQVYPEWTDLMADHQSKDGGWSIALDLPADPKQRRAGFYLCNEVIQLIEDAYIDLNLEAEFEHPDNRGWMNLLKHWSWSGMFRATWAISASIYGARFQRFCERRLDLKPGIVALRNELLGRDEMRRADVGFWGGVKNSHGIDFWEAQLIQVFLTVGAGHALDLGRVRIVPFAMDIGRLPAGKAALTFNVGFALMAGDALVYFRIQDHVRKMGLGRAALRALMKAHPHMQYKVEFAQMPPEGVPTPAGSAPDDAFPSAAALQQFKNLFESVRAEIGARARE